MRSRLTFSSDGQWHNLEASQPSPGYASSHFFSAQTIWYLLGLKYQFTVGPIQPPTLLAPFPEGLRKKHSGHKCVNKLDCQYLLEESLESSMSIVCV